MSLLDHPEAQPLLNDAIVTPETVEDCADRLTDFLQRDLPKFYRAEHRENATRVIRGLLSGLERKTCEPIAIQAGLPRKPIQFFVGAGKWDDENVMCELRNHVREELAKPDGVVVIDPSAFPKKGTESCGVGRQWCGRLGKVDNCQVGVFLAYAAQAGYAPLDRQLYLPEDWADDAARREKCHVPPEVQFQEKGRIALDLLKRSLPGLPHGWITADDELGRVAEFAPSCAVALSVTSWTCRATPWCATWNGADLGAAEVGAVPSGRPPSSGSTSGRRASRSRDGCA